MIQCSTDVHSPTFLNTSHFWCATIHGRNEAAEVVQGIGGAAQRNRISTNYVAINSVPILLS